MRLTCSFTEVEPIHNLGQNKKEQLTPFPQSIDEGARRPIRAILASLKWGGEGGGAEGWSKCSIHFVQDCRCLTMLTKTFCDVLYMYIFLALLFLVVVLAFSQMRYSAILRTVLYSEAKPDRLVPSSSRCLSVCGPQVSKNGGNREVLSKFSFGNPQCIASSCFFSFVRNSEAAKEL